MLLQGYILTLSRNITNSFFFTQKEKEFLIEKITDATLPFSLAQELFILLEKQNIFLETYFHDLLSTELQNAPVFDIIEAHIRHGKITDMQAEELHEQRDEITDILNQMNAL